MKEINENPQERFLKVFNLDSILKEELDPKDKDYQEIRAGLKFPDIKKIRQPIQLTDPTAVAEPPIYIDLPLYFGVLFNSPAILEDYGILSGYEDMEDETPPEPESTEEPTDAQLSGQDTQEPEKIKKYKIDYNAFYSTVKKKLTNTAIQYKINDQVRAGVFKLGNYEINTILYIEKENTASSVKQLYERFVKADKQSQSKQPITISYGVEVSIVSKDNTQPSALDIKNFIHSFVQQFEKYILVNDEYIAYVASEKVNKHDKQAVQQPAQQSNQEPTSTEPAQPNV